MAISTTFFSLLSPPKPQPQQLQFPLTRFPSLHNNNLRDKFVPLVANRDESTDDLSLSNNFRPGKPCNVMVVLEDGESSESLIRRFRRECLEAGIFEEIERRRFFESKRDKKKRKAREAAKRNSRAKYLRRPRPGGPGGRAGQYKPDVPKVKEEEEEEEEEDDDNLDWWDTLKNRFY